MWKKPQQFLCRMRKDALEDYTNRGFSSCLWRLKSENIPEAPSVHIWHRFTYSSICSKANGQLNLRLFKGRESFGTNISNSDWYFWKALSLCKKLLSWRMEQLMLCLYSQILLLLLQYCLSNLGLKKLGLSWWAKLVWLWMWDVQELSRTCKVTAATWCEGASAPAVQILELGMWLPGSPRNGHTGKFP